MPARPDSAYPGAGTGVGGLAPAPEWCHPEAMLFPSNQEEVFAHSAWLRGCTVERLNKTFMRVDSGERELWFALRMSNRTSVVARLSANDKLVAQHMLRRAGLRVARSASFGADELPAAWEFAAALGTPAVTKPLASFGGKGVTLDITTRAQFESGWAAALQHGDRVLVEEMIRCEADYRVLVIDEHVVAAARRWPASVVGDGRRSIEQLVADKDAVRRKIPYVGAKRFTITGAMREYLARSGRSPASIPAAGERVQLHAIANISSGGDSEDVTAAIHPGFCDVAVRAKAAFPGLFQAGVDILADDLSRSPDGQRWVICEVNANPDTSLHHFPIIGTPRDVTGALVEALFPETRARTVPRQRVALTIEGRVQGVGYRKWLRKTARLHAVDGTVRNLPDGRVEAVLQGPVKALNAVEALCAKGPAAARVVAVERRPVPVDAGIPQGVVILG